MTKARLAAPPSGTDFLSGGGEMGRLIRSKDWSLSPLGPPANWPQSLKTTISLVLGSNFPLAFAWGPERVQIYNDGFRPIAGGKHPHSMGQDFKECWASAWPVVGPAFERCVTTGETSLFSDAGMFLDRNGYLEETFFTFCYSPIRDESGEIAGMFNPVTETTHLVLAKRRLNMVRLLTGHTAHAKTVAEALKLAVQAMAGGPLDLPFAMLYRVDGADGGAQLAGGFGLERGTRACPEHLTLAGDDSRSWPLGQALRQNQPQHVTDLEQRFGIVACGPYPEPPHQALLHRIDVAGQPVALLVAGLSSRRPLDEDYRSFFDMLAAAVTAAVSNAHAVEAETKRAEGLAEIDRAKTAFFSNVSHEFRTPLTLMLSPIEDCLESTGDLQPKVRENLEVAHRNSLRLLKLVNSLLDFSRIEAGRMQACFQPTDLAVITAELASVFRSAVERGGLRLEVDCPPLGEPVHVDRDMWEKVVLNLLSNAFKHTFAGEIRVRLRRVADAAELSVQDTGTGIAADALARIFERFYRVPGARSRTHEGTGIGLALVQELVKLHSGTVAVASDVGVGTTFTVSVPLGQTHLPADRLSAGKTVNPTPLGAAPFLEEMIRWLPESPSAPVEPTVAAAASPAASPTTPQLEGARIVLADDNADMRDYVRRLLHGRYEVEAVADGEAALAAIRRRRPDLVLTDVMMPGLDGFGLLAAIRNDPGLRSLPVVVLSARAGEESTIEGLTRGADDYLVKPFSARELLARVKTHLDLARLRRRYAAELEAANKELEAFSYSVSHDLRAPLRSIDGFSQALLEDCGDLLPEVGQSHLRRVRAAAQRMAELIDDLLLLSRASRADLRREPVDLGALARVVVAELKRRDPDRRVEVEVQDHLLVEADERLMRVVLENLLGNAWKFTSKQAVARIEFGARSLPGGTEYFVKDNGAGFDMAYVEKLFRPFQRLHSEADYAGTGIGLATVQRIINRHGGHARAESRVGQGATVAFTLCRERGIA